MVNATDRPIEALLEGQIDLAVVTSEVDDKRLVTTPLFEDELVAVVAPSHPFAKRSHVEPDDFADEHLIVYTADRQRQLHVPPHPRARPASSRRACRRCR